MKKLTLLLGFFVAVAGVSRLAFSQCTKKCKDTPMLCTLYAAKSVQDYFVPDLSEIVWSTDGYSATPENVFPGQRNSYTVIIGYTCPCANAPLGEIQDGTSIYYAPDGPWFNRSYPQYCNYCLPY